MNFSLSSIPSQTLISFTLFLFLPSIFSSPSSLPPTLPSFPPPHLHGEPPVGGLPASSPLGDVWIVLPHGLGAQDFELGVHAFQFGLEGGSFEG